MPPEKSTSGIDSWAERLRFLIVLGLLALVALACEIVLVLVLGPLSKQDGRAVIGAEVVSWLALFMTGGGIAALTAAVARNWLGRPTHRYPGLKTGIGVILFYTAVFAQAQFVP